MPRNPHSGPEWLLDPLLYLMFFCFFIASLT